jgi:predicted Fe-S protein YdhL (DUF1289 family)
MVPHPFRFANLLMTAIETPCIKLCTVDPVSRTCLGCGRTLEEIGRWLAYSADERRRIMQELPARLARHPAATVAAV